MQIGIIREGKTPPDKRVPFTPKQCADIKKNFPDVKVMVQTSEIRCFMDKEYQEEGVEVVDSVTACDILMGVKEVPKSELIEGKAYFFFSHTIKEQPYNSALLRAVLDKNIKLVDYECLTYENGARVLGFGRYAGIVGAYNGLLTYAKKYDTFELKPAHKCIDKKELYNELKKVKLPAIKLVVTGGGRVASGVLEILDELEIKKVNPEDYLTQEYTEAVYTQIFPKHYVQHKMGRDWEESYFFAHPEEYKSNFMPYAKQTHIYLSAHYWDAKAPFIFTREEAKSPDFKIKVVADISCDIDGPVACTIRPSTIADPIYGYDAHSEKEVDFRKENAIAVMAVDNLPCELPRDASEDFGRNLINNILPCFFNNDKDNILKRATIAEGGELADNYKYLTDYSNR